jgi:MFS family permease
VTYLQRVARRGINFTRRQTHDFKLMLVRRALHGMATGLSMQYNSIYATLLGAELVQLGSLQSVGNAVGALAALPAGWFIDCHSLKSVFLLGTVLLTVSRLLYVLAPHWAWLYVAIILYYLGMRITCTSCTFTCAAGLVNKDRATGRGLCRTVASPVAIAASLLGAWLISRSGGISLEGIRPIYAIETLIFAGVFVLLVSQLSGNSARRECGDRDSVLSSFVAVLRQGPDVVRLMLMIGLMELPWTLTQPFMPVYAHQSKGANEFVLGSTAMASALVPMLASIPLGRLADRHGRKRVLFAITPLTIAANLCLVLAPASGLGASLSLLLYGVLFGFNGIGMALVSSMAAEVMPQEQMGRWLGIISLVRGLLGIPAPLVGGLIWEHVGPEHVFFAGIGIDLFLRLPLLAVTRETLRAMGE